VAILGVVHWSWLPVLASATDYQCHLPLYVALQRHPKPAKTSEKRFSHETIYQQRAYSPRLGSFAASLEGSISDAVHFLCDSAV
jgi:hypothetical protein